MVCRCCKKTNLEMVLDLGDQAWGNDFIPIKENRVSENFPLQVFFCNSCKMIQLGHTVPKEKMFINHAYLSGTTKSLKQHFVGVGEEILKRIPLAKDELVLDIGGNDGTFLEFFLNKSKVLNVDSGKLQAQKSREAGVQCENTFFNHETALEMEKKYGKAKVIHGSGVLFHLEELHSAFLGIKSMLAAGGTLVAEFIYLPEMIENCAYDQIYHEHLLYYSLTNFQRLLSQFNLEPYDAYLKPIHGGSCICFIGHKGEHTKTAELNALLAKEEKMGVDNIQLYKDFAKKVMGAKQELRGIIDHIKKQGKSIQALGAPVKGSTLINYCKLTEKDLDCAVEINPYKCETYCPGTRIPVYHQDKVSYPDYYLLLSWNFKNEILAKIKDFTDRGGKVIVPIPNPHVE